MPVIYVIAGALLALFFGPDLVVLGRAALHYANEGRWGALVLLLLVLAMSAAWLAHSARKR